jgi:hypothetical protein
MIADVVPPPTINLELKNFMSETSFVPHEVDDRPLLTTHAHVKLYDVMSGAM